MFYPQTWSVESIAPQWKGAFKKDLTRAFTEIYNKIKDVADPSGDDDKLSISMGLASRYRSSKSRNELLKPMADCIFKHTNIKLKEYILELDETINAAAGPCSIYLTFGSSPLYSRHVHNLMCVEKGFKEFINIYKIAYFLDRSTGKLKKEMELDGFALIHSKFFDLLYSGDIEIDMLTSIMLHEVGHIVDSLDQAIRMTCVSDLAEDMIGYREVATDKNETYQLLMLTERMINKISRSIIGTSFKKTALKSVEKLKRIPEDERDSEWIATVRAIYTIAVRETEMEIGRSSFNIYGKPTTDSIMNDDLYRGSERRADKFATMQMGGDQTIIFCDIMLDCVKLKNIMAYSKARAKLEVYLTWKVLVPNDADYDTMANRADEVLRNKYMILSHLEKKLKSHELAEELRVIAFLRPIISDMKNVEKEFAQKWRFFKDIKKYGGRAFSVFRSRSRLDQNSVLSAAIRTTARSSIHEDAAKLRLLGMESLNSDALEDAVELGHRVCKIERIIYYCFNRNSIYEMSDNAMTIDEYGAEGYTYVTQDMADSVIKTLKQINKYADKVKNLESFSKFYDAIQDKLQFLENLSPSSENEMNEVLVTVRQFDAYCDKVKTIFEESRYKWNDIVFSKCGSSCESLGNSNWNAIFDIDTNEKLDNIKIHLANFFVYIDVFLEREYRKALPDSDHRDFVDTQFTVKKAQYLQSYILSLKRKLNNINVLNPGYAAQDFISDLDLEQFEEDRLGRTKFDKLFLDKTNSKVVFEKFLFNIKAVKRALLGLEQTAAMITIMFIKHSEKGLK